MCVQWIRSSLKPQLPSVHGFSAILQPQLPRRFEPPLQAAEYGQLPFVGDGLTRDHMGPGPAPPGWCALQRLTFILHPTLAMQAMRITIVVIATPKELFHRGDLACGVGIPRGVGIRRGAGARPPDGAFVGLRPPSGLEPGETTAQRLHPPSGLEPGKTTAQLPQRRAGLQLISTPRRVPSGQVRQAAAAAAPQGQVRSRICAPRPRVVEL